MRYNLRVKRTLLCRNGGCGVGQAVELYFDPTTEAAVRQLRRALSEGGIPTFVEHIGDRPPISLWAGDNLDVADAAPLLATLASEVPPFELRLSAIATFPTAEGVIFLMPAPTPQLLAVHAALHQRLRHGGIPGHAYYQPGA